MNGFTSGTQALQGRKINHDSYPNVWEGHSPRNRMRADTDMFRKGAPFNHERYRYLPRPEFDVHDNPILAAFRADDGPVRYEVHGRRPSLIEHYLDQIEGAERDPVLAKIGLGVTATPEQVIHARRVLLKLKVVYA